MVLLKAALRKNCFLVFLKKKKKHSLPKQTKLEKYIKMHFQDNLIKYKL